VDCWRVDPNLNPSRGPHTHDRGSLCGGGCLMEMELVSQGIGRHVPVSDLTSRGDTVDLCPAYIMLAMFAAIRIVGVNSVQTRASPRVSRGSLYSLLNATVTAVAVSILGPRSHHTHEGVKLRLQASSFYAHNKERSTHGFSIGPRASLAPSQVRLDSVSRSKGK
jgi:hypothetical protein